MYLDAVQNAQTVLQGEAGYTGAIDGQAGAQSMAAAWRVAQSVFAAPAWTPARRVIAAAQVILARLGFEPGPPDGLYGVQTDGAFTEWRYDQADPAAFYDARAQPAGFGHQADVAARFGPAGHPDCTAGKVRVPWRMVLAWDTRQVITSFACHKLAAASAQTAFDRIAATHDPVKIRDLGLHLFGGCYNYRKMRGGSGLSMHAYGLAIDFDPARNRLSWHADRARLAKSDATAFWDAWAAVGWCSLGRARDYDWMHVQAPGL